MIYPSLRDTIKRYPITFNSVKVSWALWEHFFMHQMAGVFSPISDFVSAQVILSSISRLST